MKKMSKIVLNKIAQRPTRVIATRAVVLYKCSEGGLEYQRWIEVDTTLMKDDKLILEFKFDDFVQQNG